MWVIKVKGKEEYLSEGCTIVGLKTAKTYKNKGGALKSLRNYGKFTYPEWVKDRTGYEEKDFEFIEVQVTPIKIV